MSAQQIGIGMVLAAGVGVLGLILYTAIQDWREERSIVGFVILFGMCWMVVASLLLGSK